MNNLFSLFMLPYHSFGAPLLNFRCPMHLAGYTTAFNFISTLIICSTQHSEFNNKLNTKGRLHKFK